MPVHEDEHARESVRRASEHGTRDHFARTGAQARGGANSAHARAEQVGRAGTDTRRTEKASGFYLAKPAEFFAQFCLTKQKESLATMKTTTPPVSNSMKHSSCDYRLVAGLLIPLALVCFTLLPRAEAVGPDTDGTIPGSNNGEGVGVLVSRTAGVWNTGTGFEA